jgi:L-threonylcarbamoyladenylate synthase
MVYFCVMAETGKDINKAKFLLENGKLVAIPTETVYGLAGNALDKHAVAEIFRVKNRPSFDPLIIHVPDIGVAENYVSAIPPAAVALAKNFWPGPLTLVLKKKSVVPDLVSAGLDTVGIRCPNHALTRSLLAQLDFPLAAPSANPFGYVSPTSALHVNDQLGNLIPYILDGGICEVGIESTIVGFESGKPVVYRMGGVSIEAIEKITGALDVRSHSASNPVAPGQLKNHYAPKTKVLIGNIGEMLNEHEIKTSGVLSFQRSYNAPNQIILSRSGSLEEAAHNLFSALRRFDQMEVRVVLAELVPETGLGKAINDRLRRAAAE